MKKREQEGTFTSPLPSFETFRARLQDAPDIAAQEVPQAGSEMFSQKVKAR